MCLQLNQSTTYLTIPSGCLTFKLKVNNKSPKRNPYVLLEKNKKLNINLNLFREKT